MRAGGTVGWLHASWHAPQDAPHHELGPSVFFLHTQIEPTGNYSGRSYNMCSI